MPKENESTYNTYPAHREYVDGDAQDKQAIAATSAANPMPRANIGSYPGKDARKKDYNIPKHSVPEKGQDFPRDDNGVPFVYVDPPSGRANKGLK